MSVFFTTAVSKPLLEKRIETFDNVSSCPLTRFWGTFFLVSISAKKWKKCYQWDSTKTFILSCGWNVNKKSALFFIGSNMHQIWPYRMSFCLYYCSTWWLSLLSFTSSNYENHLFGHSHINLWMSSLPIVPICQCRSFNYSYVLNLYTF